MTRRPSKRERAGLREILLALLTRSTVAAADLPAVRAAARYLARVI